MARYLLTGVAGFIAARVADILLDEGHSIVGVDNMNDAYDVRMKEYRLEQLLDRPGFKFAQIDIADFEKVENLVQSELGGGESQEFAAVINLAARGRSQAVCRKSLGICGHQCHRDP